MRPPPSLQPVPPPPEPPPRRVLPWPLPALLVWMLAWLANEAVRSAGAAPAVAWLAGVACGTLLARAIRGSHWRRAIAATGFPLSTLVVGLALPPWAWAAAAALLVLAYPLSAWRDAPFFPTPADALRTLPELLPLSRRARVLDAGCGLGHALVALRAAYPEAELDGVERSALLAWACRWRCRGRARVVRGDMWRTPWHGYDLVYVFQRPESMARAWEKARREMPGGGWFVSLEFEVPRAFPHLRLKSGPDARPLWVYRVGVAQPTQPRRRETAPLALVGSAARLRGRAGAQPLHAAADNA